MNGTEARYWEGRTPSPSFFAPVDPYQEQPDSPFELSRVLAYAKREGKKIVELTYEEVQQFAVAQ